MLSFFTTVFNDVKLIVDVLDFLQKSINTPVGAQVEAYNNVMIAYSLLLLLIFLTLHSCAKWNMTNSDPDCEIYPCLHDNLACNTKLVSPPHLRWKRVV